MTMLTGSEGGQPGQDAQAPASGNSGGIANGTTQNTSSISNSSHGNGSSHSDWRVSLPEELRSNPALSQIQDVQTLAKSYVHAQSMIGKKGVIPPTEKSSPEEWDQFFNTLGRPPLEKYELKAPENKELNPEMMGWYKEKAHKLGLLPKQAQELLNEFSQFEANSLAKAEQEMQLEAKQQIESLKKEWGAGFERQLGIARQVVKEGGEEFRQYIDETGMGNDARLIKFLAEFGSKFLKEDQLRGDGSGKMGKTPAELDKEIESVRANPAYFDANHGHHKLVTAQMEELMRQRFPQ